MKKWVLITGGSRGIGAAIVHKLAEDYKVIFTYKNSTDKAKKIVDNMISNGLDVSSYQCDSSNSKEINLLCDQLISKYGAPFALINDSGISQDEQFINSSEDSIYKLFNNNAFSTMNIIRYFLPHMMQNLEGRIINISSIASFKGNIGQVGYSSTKSALNGMIKSLALENISNCLNSTTLLLDLDFSIPFATKLAKFTGTALPIICSRCVFAPLNLKFLGNV